MSSLFKTAGLVLFWVFVMKDCYAQSKANEPMIVYAKKIDSLQLLKASFGRDTSLIYFYHKLLVAHEVTNFNIDKYESEYKAFEALVKKTDWQRGKALFKYHLAGNTFRKKKEVEAIGLFLEAEKELEKVGDVRSQIGALNRVIAILGNNTKSLSAEPFILKIIQLAKSTKEIGNIESALNAAGDFYMNRQKWDKALALFLENDKIRKVGYKQPLNDESFRINTWVNQLNIGMCYLNLNNEKLGLDNVLNVLNTMSPDANFTQSLHKQVRYDLVVYFINKKKFDEAEKYLKEIEKLTSVIGRPDMNEKLSLQKFYFQINKGRLNYPEAIKNLEKYQAFNDTLIQNETQNKIDGFKSQLKLQDETKKREESELKNLQIENEKQKQFQWFVIIGGILALVALLYVLNMNRTLKKNNQELAYKNQEITEALIKGQTIERKRVAMDLHDNLGTTLSALWLSVDAIDKSKMNEEEKTIHQNLRENLEKAYNDVRLLSHNLLPEEFEKQGLVPTLQGLVRKINKNSTIKFDLAFSDGFDRVANKVEFELYSICLELVNNILKHSKATEAKIELSKVNKEIKLVVSDNGIGIFDNDSDGIGMKNVKARVDSLNGIWNIESKENKGINSTIIIPV